MSASRRRTARCAVNLTVRGLVERIGDARPPSGRAERRRGRGEERRPPERDCRRRGVEAVVAGVGAPAALRTRSAPMSGAAPRLRASPSPRSAAPSMGSATPASIVGEPAGSVEVERLRSGEQRLDVLVASLVLHHASRVDRRCRPWSGGSSSARPQGAACRCRRSAPRGHTDHPARSRSSHGPRSVKGGTQMPPVEESAKIAVPPGSVAIAVRFTKRVILPAFDGNAITA